MKILAFESSCDETAVAVVEDGRRVLSDAIASQADMHALYGGVVPEIASRKHVEAIAALTDKALADAGNEVMNHSSTHPHMAQLSAEQIEAEVNTCADKIKDVTGTRPTLFRCPYGEYNDTVISAINALGMHAVQWDVDSLDWKGLSGDEITSRVLTRVQPGSIVLFHNAAEHTPEALAGIIEALIADGYTILPVSQMLLPGDTHIDPNGRQCPADADAGT